MGLRCCSQPTKQEVATRLGRASEEAEEHVEVKDAGQATHPPRRCATHVANRDIWPENAEAPEEDVEVQVGTGKTTTADEQGMEEPEEEGQTGGTTL